MPKFLDRSEFYRIIQRELPEESYPDGAPSAYYSTADSDATAALLETTQKTLERIYENYFPQSTDEKIADWELKVFGEQLDSSASLQERRDRILAKIRTRKRCTPGDILKTIYTVLPMSVYVELVPWGCSTGGWTLDESELEISTQLNQSSRLEITGPDLCQLDAADFGMTEEDYLAMREEAYTYDVRIYDYTLTAQQLYDLNKALLSAEPARSQHNILDGLNIADSIAGETL